MAWQHASPSLPLHGNPRRSLANMPTWLLLGFFGLLCAILLLGAPHVALYSTVHGTTEAPTLATPSLRPREIILTVRPRNSLSRIAANRHTAAPVSLSVSHESSRWSIPGTAALALMTTGLLSALYRLRSTWTECKGQPSQSHISQLSYLPCEGATPSFIWEWSAAAVAGGDLEPEEVEEAGLSDEPSGVSDPLSALEGGRELDAIVIGSGIGGLCCAAMLARYGRRVAVFEAHSAAGGVAHTFRRNGYTFDSGPSFHAGLSQRPSPNPLKQVLDAIGEEVQCVQYDFWNCYFPEGLFVAYKDAARYKEEIRKFSPKGYEEFCIVENRLRPLFEAAAGVPTPALRWDPWVVLSVAQRMQPLALLKSGLVADKIQAPYSKVLEGVVTDKFLKGLLDLETNVLSGMLPEQTITAEMAVMHFERDRGTIDYPVEGGGAIIDALVRGIRKLGGTVHLRQPVGQIVVENGSAVGVKLSRNGQVIRARTVISNATVWDTFGKLMPPGALPSNILEEKATAPMTDSFMHLHLGIDATGLPDDLPIHHLAVQDWDLGVTAPQNLVIMSIPSVFNKKLAPPGKHCVHAYVAANEPYDLWKGMDRRSPEYKELKRQRAEVLYKSLENVIPDIRQRVELELIGSPLTHERFTRRYKGTYGAAYSAAEGSFPGPKTALPGLYHVGDSTSPGIGVPAAAASGMICANTIVPFGEHSALLDALTSENIIHK